MRKGPGVLVPEAKADPGVCVAQDRPLPNHPESETRSELRAALADLRHLEGFLAGVGQEYVVSSLPDDDDALSRFAARAAKAPQGVVDVFDGPFFFE